MNSSFIFENGRDRETEYLSSGLVSKCLQWPGLGQAEAGDAYRSPRGWQAGIQLPEPLLQGAPEQDAATGRGPGWKTSYSHRGHLVNL